MKNWWQLANTIKVHPLGSGECNNMGAMHTNAFHDIVHGVRL